MPAFLIRHPGKTSADILVEDPALTLAFHGNWAVFSTHDGVHLAIPANEAQIQRVDDTPEPAPQEE